MSYVELADRGNISRGRVDGNRELATIEPIEYAGFSFGIHLALQVGMKHDTVETIFELAIGLLLGGLALLPLIAFILQGIGR